MTLLTKLAHSCIRLDDGDRHLAVDPGVFSDVAAALDGTDAVLITHEHPDHVDVAALTEAARANSRLRVWAPQAVVTSLADLGDQVTAVAPGSSFEAGGFSVDASGGQHALIHATIPVVANLCFLIDGTVYHPGDSFIVPTEQVEFLLLPLHAPWSKTAEVIDFAVSVRAPRATGIHDSLLTDNGRAFVEGHVQRIAGEHEVTYLASAPGDTLTV